MAATALFNTSDKTADWRTFAGAMGKTGAGSIASGLLSALATKVVAVMLGPAAVALVATLQQIQQTAVAAATLNGQTALVQGASVFTGRGRGEYLRTAMRLFAAATLLVAALMIAWPAKIAGLAGLPATSAHLVRWLVIPVALGSVFTFATSLLRVIGEVGKLAAIQVVAALGMALACWPAAIAARAGHSGGLVAMLTVSAAAAVAGALAAIVPKREILAVWFRQAARGWTLGATRHFFAISGAMLATSLLGSAVLLAVRARVTRISGSASTGQFDAAWGISMNHVTLILAAMQVYYLPLLAGARDAIERRRHIANGLTLAICAATPVIIGIALIKPALISILYSGAFHPAARYLRWTLIGDYLKVTSWVVGMPILAAADMRAFLTADVSTQAAFWGGAWLLSRVIAPAEAAAIAFLMSYAVNFTVCYFYARGRLGFRFGRRIAMLWVGGLGLVSAASLGVNGL